MPPFPSSTFPADRDRSRKMKAGGKKRKRVHMKATAHFCKRQQLHTIADCMLPIWNTNPPPLASFNSFIAFHFFFCSSFESSCVKRPLAQQIRVNCDWLFVIAEVSKQPLFGLALPNIIQTLVSTISMNLTYLILKLLFYITEESILWRPSQRNSLKLFSLEGYKATSFALRAVTIHNHGGKTWDSW